ncbi:MAG: excinuclease ABC subunit UvrA [Pirellulaceae bacterium]|nr:excinuclease ABC subunit UvrA [Pirellulaceae bacterium]
MKQPIQLRGVRVHNLQNVDVDIPRGKLVAVCGVSGSGKTSLALDTLYAEGQRRYIESFSAYTRQFLERLDKPDYDSITNLPPALAVTRRGASRSNRSTIGTASEALDYLRLLYSKIADLHCYGCGRPVVRHDPASVARLLDALPGQVRMMIGFRTQWDDVAERATILADLQASGFVRLACSGRTVNLGQQSREELIEALPVSGQVWVIVDRVKGGETVGRTTESLEHAFQSGLGEIALFVEAEASSAIDGQATPELPSGSVHHESIDGTPWRIYLLSSQLRCLQCGIDYPNPEPRLFSFNSPLGACALCEGFGDTVDLDMNLVVPNPSLTLREGAIAPWNIPSARAAFDELIESASRINVRLDVPYSRLNATERAKIIDGVPAAGFGGLKGFFEYLERKKYKMHVRVFLARWRSYSRCPKCEGKRLNLQSLAFSLAGLNLAQLCALEIDAAIDFLHRLFMAPNSESQANSTHQLTPRQREVGHELLEQVWLRLGYLQTVGLGYLTLDRTLRTLSGGECQRTALTAALGSSLVNMLYVLDEPSVGLHPYDVQQLSLAIEGLARRGNTVVMVEHEEALLEKADWLIEVGPQAGTHGGRITFEGTLDQMRASPESLTGAYLSNRRSVPMPAQRRPTTSGWLKLVGCTGHNLQNVTVPFPLGVLCLVTGVSGSGKSSLVQDTLYGALMGRLGKPQSGTLPFEDLIGDGHLDDCVLVDQSPISRSPRSNPITYIKAFDEIRQVFAETVDARTHNYGAGHFSFNSDLGRCQTCQGDGVLEIDMQFLADIYVNCPACSGKRYRQEILAVRYRDRNIADVLSMTVREAIQFFRGAGKAQQKLQVLADVGLDYLQLGQSATTLSAGEAQRLKLAAHLVAASPRRTLFLLDEPTTGLHTADIVQLLDTFDALLAGGHSLIVVEHNVHLMAVADYVIDLGPGAAGRGGRVVAQGTPEEVALVKESLTAPFLQAQLSRSIR